MTASNEPREAAVGLLDALDKGPVSKVQKAKVTAVNTGPPLTVDLLIEDRWAVPKVRYLKSYSAPAVNDVVYLLVYGSGRRLVIGEEA